MVGRIKTKCHTIKKLVGANNANVKQHSYLRKILYSFNLTMSSFGNIFLTKMLRNIEKIIKKVYLFRDTLW